MITVPTCREKSGERSYNRVNRHSVFPYTAKYTISMSEDWLKPREKMSYTEALKKYIADYVYDAWDGLAPLTEEQLEEDFERVYDSGTAPPLEFPITTQEDEDYLEAMDRLSQAKRGLRKVQKEKALQEDPAYQAREARRAYSEMRFRQMGFDVSDPEMSEERRWEILDNANLAKLERRVGNLKGNMAAAGVPETVRDFEPMAIGDQDAYWKEQVSIEEGWPYVVVKDSVGQIKNRERHQNDPRRDYRVLWDTMGTDPNSDAGFMLQQRLLGMNPSAVNDWRADHRDTVYQSPFRPAPLVDESAGHGAGLQPVPPVSGYEVPEFLMLPPER